MASVIITPIELQRAAKWVEEHQAMHSAPLSIACIAIRVLESSGIGSRVVVMCEECEKHGVRAQNAFDVTDYDSW